ncbi:MAG: hypothetical protein ACR5LA_09335 [Wolbachia sp.]
MFGSDEEKTNESTSQADANVSLPRSEDEEDNSYSATNTDV